MRLYGAFCGSIVLFVPSWSHICMLLYSILRGSRILRRSPATAQMLNCRDKVS
jgi:hypothetical protein